MDDTPKTLDTEAVTPAPETPPTGEPEVAGEAPPEDPNVIGNLELNEIQQLNFLRQQSTQVTLQIGQLEIQKAGLIGRLGEFERQAHEAMQVVGKRLGISDGAQWQVGIDGKIRLLASPEQKGAPAQGVKKPGRLGLVGPDGKELPAS